MDKEISKGEWIKGMDKGIDKGEWIKGMDKGSTKGRMRDAERQRE